MSLRNMDLSTSEPVRDENGHLQGTKLPGQEGEGDFVISTGSLVILFFKLCTHSIEEFFCNFSKHVSPTLACEPLEGKAWVLGGAPTADPHCSHMSDTTKCLSLPHSTHLREKEGGPFRINKIKTHKKRLLGQTDPVVQAPEPN